MSIGVKTGDLQQYVELIREKNVMLSGYMDVLMNQIQGLQNIWESPASERLIQSIYALKPTFESYEQCTDNYARYLDGVIVSYETLDGLIESKVGE